MGIRWFDFAPKTEDTVPAGSSGIKGGRIAGKQEKQEYGNRGVANKKSGII